MDITLRSTGVGAGVGLIAALLFAAAGAESPAPARKDAPDRQEEQRVLELLEHLRQTQSRGMMNVPPEDGRLLRSLTQAIGARHVVEIGTSNGYSGIWICMGLRHTGGKLTTFEIDEGRAALARENFNKAGCSDIVRMVLGDAHQEVTRLEGPVDLVFLDADKAGYADYLRKLLPIVRPGGLILAHNTTTQASEMAEFIDVIKTHPDLETSFVNVTPTGMSLTLKKR